MTDRRRRAAPAESASEDNPFAPPPDDRPDRPWEPRHQGGGSDGSGSGSGSSGGDGSGSGGGDDGDRPGRWGGKWSPRQPGRQSGGFGRPGQQDGGGQGPDGPGQGPGGGKGSGMRWDPTDRYQRHARYSLHTGIWGLFFALFSLLEIALLLGALSVYWGVSGLRAKPGRAGSDGDGGTSGAGTGGTGGAGNGGRADDGGRGASPVPVSVTPAQAAKARTSAAITGLVTGGLTLTIVASTFSLQLVYSDYYECRNDSLTQASRQQCDHLVPDGIRPVLEGQT
ncbi:hypothetical protein [Streptomyces sp. Z26]|uniref:hypothetical protein n=1 Tax=Streptomyces sp. Z26 TaxID=2500177 RepID=UPI000EF15AFD|nr:hypothetical protein [Streptomyces sp. Z26]RLL68532.1 hypothetical protein D7M15_18720 [Streptomyces sp. Z26]